MVQNVQWSKKSKSPKILSKYPKMSNSKASMSSCLDYVREDDQQKLCLEIKMFFRSKVRNNGFDLLVESHNIVHEKNLSN